MDDLIERLRDAGFVLVSPGMRKLANDAADRIADLEADKARLMGLVEAAYREGSNSGFEEGASFGPTESCWESSKARATLAKIKEATDGRVTD